MLQKGKGIETEKHPKIDDGAHLTKQSHFLSKKTLQYEE